VAIVVENWSEVKRAIGSAIVYHLRTIFDAVITVILKGRYD
jgi:hypothetical protein